MGSSRTMRELIALGFVAPLPAIARARIKERYKCDLGPFGHDCDGLNRLRDLIAEMDPDRRHRNALYLTAAHTHWGECDIVESFDEKSCTYFVGAAEPEGKRLPYSFVFSLEGPVPFEWCDGSVPINETEFEEIREFIVELNAKVVERWAAELPMPIGLMIDHRFKRSIWDARLYSFIEGDAHECDGRAKIRFQLESVEIGRAHV